MFCGCAALSHVPAQQQLAQQQLVSMPMRRRAVAVAMALLTAMMTTNSCLAEQLLDNFFYHKLTRVSVSGCFCIHSDCCFYDLENNV